MTTRASWRSVARSTVFDPEIVDSRPGYFCYRIPGDRAYALFRDEAGGHRIQQVPENDRKGRVQTSTITVAVLPEPTASDVVLKDSDLVIRTCRGSGAGGQHRNKTESAVQVQHVPTGLTVRCESERSQPQNRVTALAVLRARILDLKVNGAADDRARDRRTQVGAGMRADKRRTIRYQDGTVNDHVTGRSWKLRDYLKGQW